MVAGVCALLMRPGRLIQAAIVLQPSTLVRFHRALVQPKYRLLFSSTVRKTPGPKGPHPDIIAAIVAMKQRNPTWGCPRLAQQIAWAFGIVIDKDVESRILAARYQPGAGGAGPSWLTTLGHTKDRLWSLDLFRCESASLRTLGARRDGPLDAAPRRLWCAPGRRRRGGTLPHVQSRDLGPTLADLPQRGL